MGILTDLKDDIARIISRHDDADEAANDVVLFLISQERTLKHRFERLMEGEDGSRVQPGSS